MTASLAGYLASAGAPLYSAAKHGIVGLMRALKGETSKVGIAVSVIAPGITVTPILITGNAKPEKHDPEDYAKDMASAGVPINRVESVALAVCWLLNEESKVSFAFTASCCYNVIYCGTGGNEMGLFANRCESGQRRGHLHSE